MINLLPPDVSESLLYARRNTKLLHWVGAGLVAIAGIGVLVFVGRVYINRTTNLYAQTVDTAKNNEISQKVDAVQAQVEQITNQLKLTTQVLSGEILFSKLIKQIGAVMPANTVLTNLDISKGLGAIDLQAAAVDNKSSTQIQVNLSDPTAKLFDKVDIVNINCLTGTAADATSYPCTVNLRAQFSKNNQFLAIAPSTGSGQ